MSVQEKIPYVSYIANGSTVKFNIPFDLHDAGYLVVTVDKMIPAVGGYIVNLNDMSITFVTAPRSGAQVELYRDTKLKRDTNYQSYDNSFRPSSVNFDFDSIWQALQDQHMVDARIAARIREEIEQRRVADGLMQGQIEILNQVILSVFNDASSEYVANKLTELNSIIQTAAAAGAGANGWTASLVVDGDENQHQINRSTIRAVESIVDLLAIPNPKNGNTQRVKSFDVGFNIGGGHFTYDETKASINNGVTIFNGWVRNCNPNRVKASYAGLRGDGTQDIRTGFKNLSDYLSSLNKDMKKHLKIDAGIYQILTIQRYDAGQASYCTFAAVDNLSIVGDGKEVTTIRFPDWVLDLIDGNEVIRDFAVFSDNQQNIKNFSVNHVGFDFNADNNYYRTDEESNGPLRKAAMAFKFVGYEFENLDFSNNRYYRNPFYNSVIVMAYKKPNGSSSVNNVKVNNCEFIRGGDGANLGLNKVHDHSSIFLAGKDLQALRNSFVTVQGSNVSCGIEMHNYGVMSNNYFENYSVPLHAVSEEDMGCNIIASGNIAFGAVYGLSHNCKDPNSTVTYVGNKIQLRGEKALFLPSNNGLTFRHGGYESGGGVNNATALHNHDPKIYLKANTFEQLPPIGGWEWSDNIINACMAVKEVQVFEATDNTFIGFQGAALEVLTNNGQQLRSNSRLLLRNNTYIRCGFSSNNADGFGDFNSAYRITGNGATLPYDLGILDVQGDKFIECKYGALVGNYLPEVFMNKISVSEVKVSGGFINPIFMKPSHINLQSACSISYSYQDTQDITYTPSLLSKGNVAFDLNIIQEDAYSKPYFELQYKKTFSNSAIHLNAKGYGQVSGTQQIGFFAHAIGDTYTPLDVSFDQFSKFYYSSVSGVNQWRGVAKVQ